MREFGFLRKAVRSLFLKQQSEPDIPKNTVKRKKFSGSYSDIMNLPSGKVVEVQDTAGLILWQMDYDPLP